MAESLSNNRDNLSYSNEYEGQDLTSWLEIHNISPGFSSEIIELPEYICDSPFAPSRAFRFYVPDSTDSLLQSISIDYSSSDETTVYDMVKDFSFDKASVSRIKC